ncbi:MAG: hypothetical protein B7Z72_04730, partial [Gemmatimonadetes bacterium 21-71-4]
AFALGALHALEPGHGKSLASAYLVAGRHTKKDAVVLGLATTLSHTAVVLLLALGSLGLRSLLPAGQLERWVRLLGAGMLVALGAWNAVRAIVRALRVSSRMIEGRMGISGAQLFVMQQLADRPAHSMNELADRTATHQSSVSVVVRRLVDHGYVSRTTADSDRRRVELALTDKGREVLAGAPTTVQVKLLRGARALGAAERKTLAHLLEAWVRAAGIEDAAPPLLGEEAGDNGT